MDSSNGLAFVEWINRRIGVQVESNCLFYYPSNSPQFNIDQFDRGIEFATPTETLHSYTVVSVVAVCFTTVCRSSVRPSVRPSIITKVQYWYGMSACVNDQLYLQLTFLSHISGFV